MRGKFAMYALVDCNNFYVSCERIFKPALERQPVVVLSNNDGCIVARSNEVKAMGIKMGTPYFKVSDFLKCNGVSIFSSNYALYGDISSRIMTILSEFCPELEIYSIDEAFLDLHFIANIDFEKFGDSIHNKILHCIGIPVSVGIAPTRTLAKLANHLTKKNCIKTDANSNNMNSKLSQTCVLRSTQDITNLEEQADLEDIWGIGKRSAERLRNCEIRTIEDFINAESCEIRKILGVCGNRTQLELKGQQAVTLESASIDKKSVCHSRSFSKTVADFNTLQEAVAHYTSSVMEKIRLQGLIGGSVTLFLKTRNSANLANPQYISATSSLPMPSSRTSDFLQLTSQLLKDLYSENKYYKSAGVIITDLSSGDSVQGDLFSLPPQNNSLDKAIDLINNKFGKGTLFHASEGIKRKWEMKRDWRSPSYTTSWKELPQVMCLN